MKIQVGDVEVTCEHPKAEQSQATSIANTLNEAWLDGHSQDKPLFITVNDYKGTIVTYKAEIVKLQ